LSFLIFGCSTLKQEPPNIKGRNIPFYLRDTPSNRHEWIFITFPAYSSAPGHAIGYPAEIRLPKQIPTTNAITVFVGGEIPYTDSVTLRTGATVLQAIVQAGGFTIWGNPRKVRVYHTDGSRGDLKLFERNVGKPAYRQVWLSETSEAGFDATLRDGDRIYVPRVIF
jgi:hypothetical protein